MARRHMRRGALYAAVLLGACSVPLEHFSRPDAGDDASGACEQPREVCAGQCVDVTESSTHCGRCGHDCGGGACVASACQPALIADADDQLDGPSALAVNATAIFWAEQARVRSCPLPSGCTAPPAVIAQGYSLLDAIAVTEDAVYFTGCAGCTDHHDLLRCPVAGCSDPAAPVTSSISAYADIVVGRTHAFWREDGDAVVTCQLDDCAGSTGRYASSAFGGPVIGLIVAGDTAYVKPAGTTIGSELRACNGGVCAPATIVTNSNVVVPPFRIQNNQVYWLADGPGGKLVRTCALANCGNGSSLAGSDLAMELAVDDTGVYWFTSAGALRSCALTGCPASGPATLASGRASPRQLTLGTSFLYWIEGNTIVRLAKR